MFKNNLTLFYKTFTIVIMIRFKYHISYIFWSLQHGYEQQQQQQHNRPDNR